MPWKLFHWKAVKIVIPRYDEFSSLYVLHQLNNSYQIPNLLNMIHRGLSDVGRM